MRKYVAGNVLDGLADLVTKICRLVTRKINHSKACIGLGRTANEEGKRRKLKLICVKSVSYNGIELAT